MARIFGQKKVSGAVFLGVVEAFHPALITGFQKITILNVLSILS
jgi:hypothetical protein